MSTILFTTTYFGGGYGKRFLKRIRRWLEYYQASPLKYDRIVMLDDASPHVPPEYPRLYMDQIASVDSADFPVLVISFRNHFGHYRGWARSFCSIPEVCHVFGARRAIFLESDACVRSKRLFRWLNRVNKGWHAMWCPRHSFAETSIQVIIGQALRQVAKRKREFGPRYHHYGLWEHDMRIPHIVHQFSGDRYEHPGPRPPKHPDFICQHIWR